MKKRDLLTGIAAAEVMCQGMYGHPLPPRSRAAITAKVEVWRQREIRRRARLDARG